MDEDCLIAELLEGLTIVVAHVPCVSSTNSQLVDALWLAGFSLPTPKQEAPPETLGLQALGTVWLLQTGHCACRALTYP